MTRIVTATFDGNVLIPSGKVDLPKGAVVRLHLELEADARVAADSLANLPACGLWAERTDMGDTPSAAKYLRRRVENREDHAR